MTRLAFTGPPLVVTATVSNTWNEPVTVITRTNARIGRSSGSVICQKERHSVLPSIAAASYT